MEAKETAANMEKGLVIKSNGGFYEVKTPDHIVTCRPRGSFRNMNVSPLVGDNVTIEITGPTGTILSVDGRRNFLQRPPVANADCVYMVVSTVQPAVNSLVLDTMIAIAESKGIKSRLVVTKEDLRSDDSLVSAYEKAGFDVFRVSGVTDEGIGALAASMTGKVNVLCGNSGAGKTSVLNRVLPGLELPTGEISRKLGRGRHTTRITELFLLPNGNYLADTPGFSFVELLQSSDITKENLAGCFIEFRPYIPACRFPGCAHVADKGCAVIAAAEAGGIPRSRHENYKALYNQVKDIKDWERHGI